MAFYQFQKEQLVNTSIDTLWDFISSPQNLKKITPKHMGFNILNANLPDKIFEGMIIRYTVRPLLRIPVLWVTEITHVQEKAYFVDEQRVGPFSLWNHQHVLVPTENGVLMKDIISYKPPLGFLGSIANFLFIKRNLKTIFDYRAVVLEQLFPK